MFTFRALVETNDIIRGFLYLMVDLFTQSIREEQPWYNIFQNGTENRYTVL